MLWNNNANSTPAALVNTKIMPLFLPLLSIGDRSAKNAKQEGIPKPKLAPKRKLIDKTVSVDDVKKIHEHNEVIAPKIIQSMRISFLATYFGRIAPIIPNVNAPT
jgi:hypothetical protein